LREKCDRWIARLAFRKGTVASAIMGWHRFFATNKSALRKKQTLPKSRNVL
jgi:hypothetical protein